MAQPIYPCLWFDNQAKEAAEFYCSVCYSWQIVPSILGELMSEPAKAERVMNKIQNMNKLDIEQLKNA